MDMTTDAPLSWIDGSNEEGCTCSPNEGKTAAGCRSASIQTPESWLVSVLQDETKAQCFCTRYLWHCVLSLCFTKEANINSIHVHGPHMMLLPCQPHGTHTSNPKLLWQALYTSCCRNQPPLGVLSLSALPSTIIMVQQWWIRDNNSRPRHLF